MINTKRAELIADLRLNHEYCPKESILKAADMLESDAPKRDKQWHDTAWQRGFQMGVSGAAKVVKDATDALAAEQKAHKETNRAMTEALMQAENASCWNDNTTVEIKVLAQGDAVCGTKGYMLKRSTSVAAFYLDGWGATGRIYPEFTSSSVWDGTSTIDYPSITISDGSDDGSLSEIYFPEYKGWRVHSVSGGKTAAICLVKEG